MINFVQKLYVTSKVGNLNADFIMIVADLSGLKNKIEEIEVPAGSELDKKVLSKSSLASYPILELESGDYLNDSLAIANYIAKVGNNSDILGSGPSQ